MYQNTAHRTYGYLVTLTSTSKQKSLDCCCLLMRRASLPLFEWKSLLWGHRLSEILEKAKFLDKRFVFSIWMIHTLHNSLLPRYCEVRLQLQEHVFLLCRNMYYVDLMPEFCHEFHLAEPSGKPSCSLWWFYKVSQQDQTWQQWYGRSFLKVLFLSLF